MIYIPASFIGYAYDIQHTVLIQMVHVTSWAGFGKSKPGISMS